MGRLRLSSPGEWSRLPIKGLAEKDRPEFKIGTVPSGKRKELLYQHFGRHQKIRTRRVKEDGESYTVSERNLDNEQTAAFAVAVASFALKDSRDLELEASTEAHAAVFKEAAGRDVAVGELVRVDGHLSAGIKELLFDELVVRLEGEDESFLDWVLARSQDAGLVVSEQEKDAGKT